MGRASAPPGALQHQIRRGCLNGALPQAKRSEFRAAAPRLSTAAQSAQRTTGPGATPTPHPPHHSQHGTAPPAPTNQHCKATFQHCQSIASQPSTRLKSPRQSACVGLNLLFIFNGLAALVSGFPSPGPNGLPFASGNAPACNCSGTQWGLVVHAMATPQAVQANGDKQHDRNLLRGDAPQGHLAPQLPEVLLAHGHFAGAGPLFCAANCARHGKQAPHARAVAARAGMHLLHQGNRT